VVDKKIIIGKNGGPRRRRGTKGHWPNKNWYDSSFLFIPSGLLISFFRLPKALRHSPNESEIERELLLLHTYTFFLLFCSNLLGMSQVTTAFWVGTLTSVVSRKSGIRKLSPGAECQIAHALLLAATGGLLDDLAGCLHVLQGRLLRLFIFLGADLIKSAFPFGFSIFCWAKLNQRTHSSPPPPKKWKRFSAWRTCVPVFSFYFSQTIFYR
jgi:hypothetical protein